MRCSSNANIRMTSLIAFSLRASISKLEFYIWIRWLWIEGWTLVHRKINSRNDERLRERQLVAIAVGVAAEVGKGMLEKGKGMLEKGKGMLEKGKGMQKVIVEEVAVVGATAQAASA